MSCARVAYKSAQEFQARVSHGLRSSNCLTQQPHGLRQVFPTAKLRGLQPQYTKTSEQIGTGLGAGLGAGSGASSRAGSGAGFEAGSGTRSSGARSSRFRSRMVPSKEF